MKSSMLSEPTLVGREHELEQLLKFLDSASEGKGTTVFLSGEAGAGKTRLTTEFLAIAKKRDVIVLSGWCLSDAPMPFFPFIEAFHSYFSTNENESTLAFNQRSGLKSWLVETNQSETTDRPANVISQAWKDHTFDSVLKELLFLSAKRPVILALDDIHWADSASLSLIHYLASQISSERILILATFRNEELADAEGNPNPLSKVLRLMGRDDLYREIQLTNLDISDVERIAVSMLGGSVQPELVAKITAESQGNPLFVVESLRMLFQQRSLTNKNGYWSLLVDSFEIPGKVKDVILRRLEALGSVQRRILNVSSVVGEKFDPKLVAGVVSIDYADVLVEMNEIVKSTLMVRNDGKSFRFNHAKFREMLYEEIPPILKKEYHNRIAERIEGTNQFLEEFTASDLAHHYLQAENKIKAIEYSLKAGKIALAQFSNTEAIKHFSYVLENISGNPENAEIKRNAQEGLGDAYYANSMFTKATKTFEDLSSSETGATKLCALRKAMESAYHRMDIPGLLELVKKAEPYSASDRLENARVLTQRGRLCQMQSMSELALEDYTVALRVFEEEYSLWDTALALLGAGCYRTNFGQPLKGIGESLRAIALFEELGDSRFQMEAYVFAGLNFGFCLLTDEAFSLFAQAIEIDKKIKMSDYQRLVYAYAFSSWVYEFMGKWGEALSCSLNALELLGKTDSVAAIGMVYSSLSRLYVRLGDLRHAEEYFERLFKLPPELLAHPYIQSAITKAVFFASKKQWEDSNQCFKEFFKSWQALSNLSSKRRAKLYLAWVLEKQGRFDESKVQFEEDERFRRELRELFEHVNIQTNLMAPARVKVGQVFEARLDIVNVSRSHGLVIRVENLLNPKLTLTRFPEDFTVRSRGIEVNEKALKPFQVKTIKLSLQAKQSGEINLNPKVVFIDDLQKTMTCDVKKICINVQPVADLTEERMGTSKPQIEFEFKSGEARKAFNFLTKAFLEDYVNRKMPLEKSGWRTSFEVVKKGNISKYSVYGSQGHGHQAITELEHRGLIEARVFTGERGRGGKILKLRVSCENDLVKGKLVAKK